MAYVSCDNVLCGMVEKLWHLKKIDCIIDAVLLAMMQFSSYSELHLFSVDALGASGL